MARRNGLIQILLECRFHRSACRLFTLLLLVCSVPGIFVSTRGMLADDKKVDDPKPQSDGETPQRKTEMAAMRRIGTSLEVTVSDDKGSRELDAIPDALFRTQDAEREEFDGTIWGYGKTGRPSALLTLVLVPNGVGNYKWLYEFNSLTKHSVTARIPNYPVSWSTRTSGLEMKDIPDAPSAPRTEAERTRQIREISARFTGYEMLQTNPKGPFDRFELRLLPRPIHRYKDPENGLIDGGILLMTHNTNPEIIMVIELSREGEQSVWEGWLRTLRVGGTSRRTR